MKLNTIKNLILIIGSFFFLTLTQNVLANAQTLSGRVVYNDGSGRGVVNITVKWLDGKGSTRYMNTDANGNFTFPGWQTLTDQNRGYECANPMDFNQDGYNDGYQANRGANSPVPVCAAQDGAYGCNEDTHTLAVIQPVKLNGSFSRNPDVGTNPDGRSAMVAANPSTINNIHVSNSTNTALNVGTFYFTASGTGCSDPSCGGPGEPPTNTPIPGQCGYRCNPANNSSDCGTSPQGVQLKCVGQSILGNICANQQCADSGNCICPPPTNTPTPTPTGPVICSSTCTTIDNNGPRSCSGNTYLYVNQTGYPAGHCATSCINCPPGTGPDSRSCGCIAPTPTPSTCSGNQACGTGGVCAGQGANGPAFNAICEPYCSGTWVYNPGGNSQCGGANPYCWTCNQPIDQGGTNTPCANYTGVCAGSGVGGAPAFTGPAPSCGGRWTYVGLDTCPQGGAAPYCFTCVLPTPTPAPIPPTAKPTPTLKPFLQTSGGSVHGQQ